MKKLIVFLVFIGCDSNDLNVKKQANHSESEQISYNEITKFTTEISYKGIKFPDDKIDSYIGYITISENEFIVLSSELSFDRAFEDARALLGDYNIFVWKNKQFWFIGNVQTKTEGKLGSMEYGPYSGFFFL